MVKNQSTIQPKMLSENLQIAAAKCENHCIKTDEILIRRGRKTYRFRVRENDLFFVAPGQPEQILIISSDATVAELKEFILSLIDIKKQSRPRSNSQESLHSHQLI